MSAIPINVVAAVIRAQDKLLVCQRSIEKRHGGLWEFPGGKVLAGESYEEAIKREIMEELEVEVSRVGQLLYSTREADSPYVIHFIDTSIVGTPLIVEHDAIEWRDTKALLGLPLAPADKEFVVAYLAKSYCDSVGLQ